MCDSKFDIVLSSDCRSLWKHYRVVLFWGMEKYIFVVVSHSLLFKFSKLWWLPLLRNPEMWKGSIQVISLAVLYWEMVNFVLPEGKKPCSWKSCITSARRWSNILRRDEDGTRSNSSKICSVSPTDKHRRQENTHKYISLCIRPWDWV